MAGVSIQTPALLRARWWSIANAWRDAAPLRKLLLAAPLLFFIVLPLLLRMGSPELSLRLLTALASLDVLPALLVTAWIIMQLLPRLTRLQREDTEEWVLPRIHRPYWQFLILAAAFASALKIPVLMAIAISLLSAAQGSGVLAREMNVSLLVAGIAGVAVSMMLSDSRANRQPGYPVLGKVVSGKALLALLPLTVFSEHLNLRRILWLAVPVMLAAETGASFNSVLRDTLPWLTGVACLLLVDSIRVSSQRLRTWVPSMLLPAMRVLLPPTFVVAAALLLVAVALALIKGKS